ncbi:lamin tail domain-containing protein [Candidatus Bipolaricaulota bacterium]|nr:lamin tail domain-containing protein [Candidatus Bipolaricaulota bacterium]
MSNSSNVVILMAIVAVLFASWSAILVWENLSAEPPIVDFVAPFHYDAGGDDTEDRLLLEDEYVTLLNQSESSIDLSGWTVRSDGGQIYTIPEGVLLPAGETLTIISGCGEDDARTSYWCSASEIWDNQSGTAYLAAPDGTRIAIHHYEALCQTCHDRDDDA